MHFASTGGGRSTVVWTDHLFRAMCARRRSDRPKYQCQCGCGSATTHRRRSKNAPHAAFARTLRGPGDHSPDDAQSRISGIPDRLQRTPRSCDLLHLAHRAGTHDAAADSSGGTFLVWLIDDQDAVVIRSAANLSAAVEVARAYREAWGGRVHYIEAPDGSLVAREDWERLLGEEEVPLPYMWTVELRTPPSARDGELVTALWITTNLDEACSGGRCCRHRCGRVR